MKWRQSPLLNAGLGGAGRVGAGGLIGRECEGTGEA